MEQPRVLLDQPPERAGPGLDAVLELPGLFANELRTGSPAVTVLVHIIYSVALGGFLSPG